LGLKQSRKENNVWLSDHSLLYVCCVSAIVSSKHSTAPLQRHILHLFERQLAELLCEGYGYGRVVPDGADPYIGLGFDLAVRLGD
jgi:hypothetical protein